MRKKSRRNFTKKKTNNPNSAIAVSSLMIFSFKTDLSVFHCQQPIAYSVQLLHKTK